MQSITKRLQVLHKEIQAESIGHTMYKNAPQEHSGILSVDEEHSMTEVSTFRVAYEWTALRDSIKDLKPTIRARFCLCLQLLGLSLLGEYYSDEANELLDRDEESILAIFQETAEPNDLRMFSEREALHCIALMYALLDASGAETGELQQFLDPRFSYQYNQRVCGAMIDIDGAGTLERVDIEEMIKALLRSQVRLYKDLTAKGVIELVTACRQALEQDWVLL
ncbi:hypothetical protein BGZ63DRAFT_379617 [Mariannaea sp. PMI_226]|nr:hypothetical protein BGZ63DRAFT_379617 [Mariannaea sp. PMI_226]